MVDQRQTVDDTEVETVSDDYQSIDLDIQSLISKFIRPIDRYRSRNAPNVLGNVDQSGIQSSDRFKESRASAFYRIMGFPTIAPDGRLFSPGFNPFLSAKDQAKRNDIIASLPTPLKKASEARENESRLRDGYFISGGLDAVLLALSMGLRNGQRPLSVTEGESMASLDDPPKQIVTIPARREFILKNYKQQGGDEIGSVDIAVSHKIAPFTTDPIIAANLDPKSGDLSVMVGAPFLEKEDLEHEYNKYLQRPGLEFILRLRLRQQNIAEQSQIAIDNIDLTKFTDEISSADQREIAAALTDNVNANAEDINQALSGGGRVEFYTINNLVKALKGLVHMYVESLETLDDVSNQIVWIPLPNDGGPERGTKVSTTFVTTKGFLDSWEIESRLANLQIKGALAKLQQEIGETADETPLQFSDFAISEFQNLASAFDEQTQEEKSKREELEAKASNALRNVEIIGGEVSGFGLIDIISIYLALWSVEVPVLLNLIDDGAAQRLNDIDTLTPGSTQSRVDSGSDAITAYTTLAERIQTILSYADGLFQRELGKLRDGGEPPVDQSNGTF
jgi:hypothetical protein